MSDRPTSLQKAQTTPDDALVDVAQEDREAAANYMAAVSALKGEYDPASMAFMDPVCDDLPIVQALARRRISSAAALKAENDGLRAALEFYADPGSWFGCYSVSDSPMNADWDAEAPDCFGKRARAILGSVK